MTQYQKIANNAITDSVIAGWIPSVLTHTARLLSAKHGLNPGEAEEYALCALEYALKPSLTGTGPRPASAGDLQALTLFKARNLIRDQFRRAKRSPIGTCVDKELPGADEGAAESPCIQRAAYEQWHSDVREGDRKALASELYARLDELFDRINLSPFRRDVFKAAYLDNESTQAVSARFGIKPNYVYNIVFHTKAALAGLAAELQAA